MKKNGVLEAMVMLANEMEIVEDEIRFLIDDEILMDVVGKSGRVIVLYYDDEAAVAIYVDTQEFLTEEDMKNELDLDETTVFEATIDFGK